MKFRFRTPSLKKRVAARTSWKRVVRHNMGLKAPRGYGWLTDPKKAAYNRVYNRTTFGLGSGAQGGADVSGNESGCGCLLVGALVFLGVVTLASLGAAAGPFLIVVAVVVGIPVLIAKSRSAKRERERAALAAQMAAEDFARQHAERAAAEEAHRLRVQQRSDALHAMFGTEVAQRILAKQVWQGQTEEMLRESLGPPADTEEKVLKTKTKRILKYFPTSKKSYALRVTVENGVVVGWADKR